MNGLNVRNVITACSLCVAMTLMSSTAGAQAMFDSMPASVAPIRARLQPDQTVFRSRNAAPGAWTTVQPAHLLPVDVDALLAEDAVRDATPGTPKRVGVTRDIPGGPVSPSKLGTWHDLPGGGALWLFRLEAADAKAIRIHFSKFDLEVGAEVRLGGILEGVDTYAGKGPNDDAAFWAAPTPGDVAYVEYYHPGGRRDVQLEIDVISHFYRDPGFLPPAAQPNVPGEDEGLLACHQSVMCHEVDVAARDAVGLMFYDGGFTCTGALLNDADTNTFAGYFLTANHCISTQSSANSLTVYWFYQQNSCGSSVPSLGLRPKSIGAKLLANSSSSDFSFLRFNNDPEDGQTFAAWTTAIPASSGAVVQGIHHPGGSWKRYALGSTTTASPICGGLPTSRFIYNDWTPNMGVTEGGSSGSPLFNSNFEVVGQLYGVCYFNTPGCNNPSEYNNVYGRFSQSYTSFSSYLSAIIPDDAYENNDSIAEAQGLDEGTHNLRLVDFDDYFKIVFDSGADVTISAAFATSAMDLDLFLLDSVGATVAASNGSSGTETIVTTIPAGIYYIRASKDNGWGGDYTLGFDAFLSECPTPAPALVEDGGYVKNRFISLVPANSGTQTALRVALVSLHHPDPPNLVSAPPDFSSFEGQVRWVGPPVEYTETTNPAAFFYGATLQCEPYFMDWGTVGLLHVFGSEIMPSSVYEIAAIAPDCDPNNANNYAPALTVETGIWGDIADPIQQPSPASRTQPDISDVSALVDKFRAWPGAPVAARSLLQPNVPDPTQPINFSDISACVDSFKGIAYPYEGPVPCP